MADVRLYYQHSVCLPSCLFIRGTCIVLKILELQPEHVQDITDCFTPDLLALVGKGRFMQFCNDTLDGITVNTSHTIHVIFPHYRHHTASPTIIRVFVLHFFLPLLPLE